MRVMPNMRDTSAPAIGSVILNWNSGAFAAEAARSVLQAGGPSRSVLIVDNGSIDNSADFLEAKLPECEILRAGRNLGFAEGCNEGIRLFLSRGAEFVLLLNADAWIAPDALERLLDAMAAPAPGAARIAAAGARVLFAGAPDRIESVGAWLSPSTGRIYHRGHGKTGLDMPGILFPDAVSGCAMLLRAEALRDVGGFDPALFCYFEDVDWCLRARERGWGVATAAQARVWHWGSASSGGRISPARLYYSTRNQLRVWETRFPLERRAALWARRGAILALWTAVALASSGMPTSAALREIRSGWRDFLAGRYGERR